MKILVIGSGGREHALCHTFHRQGHTVYAIPGNGGTSSFSSPLQCNLDQNNFEGIAKFAKEASIDLTVVGPEAPLEKGIRDQFDSLGLLLFGPTAKATKLESSKSWAKEFMTKHQIPTAAFKICRSAAEAKDYVKEKLDSWHGVVIKPSGLTAGKGVMCCNDLTEAYEAIQILMEERRYGDACDEVVIEELLEGKECSILAFCDGNTMVAMIPSQDHKRLLEDDQGPNTGGVGAYAPLPFLTNKDINFIQTKIIEKTNQALKSEKIPYQGILYFGIMLTQSGPKVLEYNCRFGDPEAQVVLPLLQSDLASIMVACLKKDLKSQKIEWKNQHACTVVMTSGGYPRSFHIGYEITGVENAENEKDVFVFHAGTKRSDPDKLLTSGGRVLAITGLGDTLEQAVQKAYSAAKKITFKDAHYRKDIAYQVTGELVP